MPRLGLVTRVGVVILGLVAAIQMLLVGIYYAERNQVTAASGLRLPLADQVAAITALVDRAPGDQRVLLLRALNADGMEVALREADLLPEDGERTLPAVEAAIRRNLAADKVDPARHSVSARVRMNAAGWVRPFPRIAALLGDQVSVVIGLPAGDYLHIVMRGNLTARVFGIPTGFFAGMVGFLVAVVGVLALSLEMRPLTRLARAVASFGAQGAPQEIAEQGAREVRVLIRAINEMQRRIAGLLRGRSLMLGMLSHDLRTYLTRLRLRVEMIPDQDARMRAARDIEDMQVLVEDALGFAAASFTGADRRPVDLNRIVQLECDERLAAGASVAVNSPAHAVMVVGSTLALGRMVGNLIDNAVKYGGEALVTVRPERDQALVVVEDRGPGIPADQREQVFEPFYRVDPSRSRESGGAGLGLAIAKQVADSMGGRIEVRDRPGGGTAISVAIPITAGES